MSFEERTFILKKTNLINDKIKVLITQEEIADKIETLSIKLNKEYEDQSVLMIGVLQGGFMFFADLIRRLTFDITLDFIQASSYGSQKVSSGEVRIDEILKHDPEQKRIIIVDDIIDTGNTFLALSKWYSSRNTFDVKTIALVDKPSRREVDFEVDYSLFKISDQFIVGYGLDYNGKYRQLPYIGVLN